MTSLTQTTITPIGNSRGVRLPKKMLERYQLAHQVTLEETSEGILIKAASTNNKLSYAETFAQMSETQQDWSDFDDVLNDGLK